MKRYKLIYLIIFTIIQICFLNTNVSFSTDNKTAESQQTIADGI